MSRSTPSNKRSSLVAGFVLNSLDAVEAEALMQMIEEDPEILNEIEQLQQTLETAYDIEEVVPLPMLRDRLLNQFASSAPAPHRIERSPSEAPAISASSRLVTLLKAAVATLAIALTLSNYFWWRSLQQATNSPQPEAIDTASKTQTYRLDPTEAGEGGTVQVALNPDDLTATLEASNLPPIASDQVYVLWTVLVPDAPYTTDPKSAILTTTFDVDNEGDSQKQLVLPTAFKQPKSVAALGVTIESASAPQAHEGVPVLLAMLEN